MKLQNKELIQSYLLTTAKYSYSVHEKRILYRLVEACQYLLEGKKLNKDFSINQIDDRIHKIDAPLRFFLKDGTDDTNHTQIKKAFTSLSKKSFVIDTPDEWADIGLVLAPKIHKKGKEKYVDFMVEQRIYEAILNFSKGFRKYELEPIFKLESTYAMRFYELISGKTTPITYSVYALREMFDLHDKYKNGKDFRKKVVDSAKSELDKSDVPYTFSYQENREGRKIVSYTLIPHYRKEKQDTSIEENKLKRKISPHHDLPRPVMDVLRNKYGFNNGEIQRNINTLKLGLKVLPDLAEFLSDKYRESSEKNSSKAWIIGAIKDEFNNLLNNL